MNVSDFFLNVIESVIDSVKAFLINKKVAVATALGTSGTGAGTILDYIPDDIGKVATLAGIFLSTIMIYIHVRSWQLERLNHLAQLENHQLEREKHLMEIGALKQKHRQSCDCGGE